MHLLVQTSNDALVAQDRWKSLEQAVKQAKGYNIKQMADWKIDSAEAFLEYASGLMTWTPSENVGGKEIYSVLCLFYIILDQPAISDLQTLIDTSSIPIEHHMTPLSRWVVFFFLRKIMGKFMDTPASITPDSNQAFVNSPYCNLDEAELPDLDWPKEVFTNFNRLFARGWKP